MLRETLRMMAVASTVAVLAPTPAHATDEHVVLTEGAIEQLHSYFAHPEWKGVVNVTGAAKAVLIAPGFTSGAVIVGIESGSGVLLVRHGEAWSDPVFAKLSQGSVGLQVGIKTSQLLMFILTREAVDQIVNGVSRVGGTGGIALGNLGIGGSGGGGISGGLQILTVSTSEGLSLGTGLAGLTAEPRTDLNAAAYGADVDMKGILAKPGGAYRPAGALRAALTDAVKHSWYD